MPMPGGENFCHPASPYSLGTAGDYEHETIRTLIHQLKFRFVTDAAKPLAELMRRFVTTAGIDLSGFIAMPIPLSRRRERRRGFNQSERIASHFAPHFAIPVDVMTLVRVKHARPQSELKNHDERKENIRGSFFVTDPAVVRGKSILLIDDVTTSGATFLEASRALKYVGAEKIIALAAARA